MAQRDYVKKKSKVKNTSRIIPNLMMAIAVILVILFVAILYFVSTNNRSKQPSSTTTSITEKPQITLPDKQEERWTYLKELENPGSTINSNQPPINQSSQDKERQQILDNFINDKPQVKKVESTVIDKSTVDTAINKTVENKIEQSVKNLGTKTNQDGSWLLQCGAFKDKVNAESLKAKLAMIGVTSFVRSEQFYRVLAGPYASKSDAEKAVVTLKNNNMTNCIITSK